MNQLGWQPLSKGDIVEIVAPSMKSTRLTLSAAKKHLQSWGLRARYPKDVFGTDMLCAQTRKKRLEYLLRAIQSKDSKAIWCIRGGYGSFHLLPELNKLKNPGNKLFIGLSDSTSLHTFFQQEWGWSTLHGSNIDRYGLGTASFKEAQELKKIIFGQKSEVEFKIKPLNSHARKKGRIRSAVVGGNLITLQGNFATPFQVQPRGKILFCEDIGERGYRVDRVLEQMIQMDLLKGLRALIFGSFTGGKEPNGKNLVPRVLQNFAERVPFPVFSGLPSGHDKVQRALPLGIDSILSKEGSTARLVCPTGMLG